MNNYSQKDIDDIIRLYDEGYSHKQIADQIGCSKSFVTNTLRRNDIPQRDKAFYAKKFSDEIELKIIEDYQNGMSTRQLADKYNCSTMPIFSMFKRRGLQFRDLSHSIRRHSIDENYFDEIDSPNKAYILGFLYTDGANTSNYEHGHYVISLTLQQRDRHILEEILAEVGSSSKVMPYFCKPEGKYYDRIAICNKHIVLRLHELGVIPNKTFSIIFPSWLDDELIPHFIRGLIDGDGSIATNLDYVNFVGTTAMCMSLRNILHQQLNIHTAMYDHQESQGINILHIVRKADKLKFLDWIYGDADMKLNRKYDLYLKMKEKYAC